MKQPREGRFGCGDPALDLGRVFAEPIGQPGEIAIGPQEEGVGAGIGDSEGGYCLDLVGVAVAPEQLDGIFINGGDQSLTKLAFIGTDGHDSAEIVLAGEEDTLDP